jgi:hypothetical protein
MHKGEDRRTDIPEAAPLNDFASSEEVLYEIGKTLATFLAIAALADLIAIVIELAQSQASVF